MSSTGAATADLSHNGFFEASLAEADPDLHKALRDELKAIVGKLEQGQGTLDSAIGDYDRGAALKRHCDSKLREAQAKIEKISLSAEGVVSAEALDVE